MGESNWLFYIHFFQIKYSQKPRPKMTYRYYKAFDEPKFLSTLETWRIYFHIPVGKVNVNINKQT